MVGIMTFEELLEKYQAVLLENGSLKVEIDNLNTQLGVSEHRAIPDGRSDNVFVDSLFPAPNTFTKPSYHGPVGKTLQSNVNGKSGPKEKIMLFKSLFKGRDDVYAKRYENKNKGTDGYTPCCLNEWKSELCKKPKIKCTACSNTAYARLDEKVIDDHLRGRGNLVAGIYPLCLDETCYFLAIDFDDGEWQKDISQFREVCSEFDLPIAIERSRSGHGAHAWIFFKSPIAATLARKLGSALLTYAMNKRHEITFKSYDRFFPNQDTMPRGGLGNLIALPLQKAARINNNSVFIDANFEPFKDQWGFMSTLQKLSEDDIIRLISKLCNGNELGILKTDDQEEPQKPWETKITVKLSEDDSSQTIKIVKENMLFILKTGISHRALNNLKLLAAFNNPEFYKAQAMRMPNYKNKIPRIISCSDETEDYLCLPRGCEADVRAFFAELKIEPEFIEKTNPGRSIDVEFNGSLWDEQPLALVSTIISVLTFLSAISFIATTVFPKAVVPESTPLSCLSN